MNNTNKPLNKKNKIRQCLPDRIFDTYNIVGMSILFVVFTWPLIFVLSASISNPSAVWNGDVVLLPVGLNFDGYKEILAYEEIWIGYRNTILYTVVGTLINVTLTICAAYPLSRKDFVPRNFLMGMFVFTMYFSGGLIPTYLVVDGLNMLDTIWAMVIPGAISVYNVIITRTYFQNSIPESLKEAADLDGANTAQFLFRIVLPLSAPIIAVISLYYGVGHWNSYFSALIYLFDSDKYPLQIFLRDILIQNQVDLDMFGLDLAEAEEKRRLAETIKYGVIIVASVPVLCIYPFIQRHFVKGIMIGALKG